VNIEYLRTWIGKSESRLDRVTSAPAAALSVTLDRDDPFPNEGDLLPPLWHWLYFLPLHRPFEINSDGMGKRGSFFPPIPLPRQMYAGNRQKFERPLRVGDNISRTSRIVDVSQKEGRSGTLAFVLVQHEIRDGAGLAVTEEQEMVYLENPKPGDPLPKSIAAPSDASWSREIHPDEILLFRFSALTFNAHRIHYDRTYVREIEGYPDLVVHGRLIVILLADLLRRNLPDATIVQFSSRAVRPLFSGARFDLSGRVEGDGKTVKLWASNSEGLLATDAVATLA
jgi:3-methylfumaryl-CoA hydratase